MEQNTDFSGWSAVKRQVQGPGFWLKVQLIALLYLAGPTLVALAINRQFGMEWVWLLFIVVLVVDYFVITRYELWAALLAGSSVYSQLGGEEGFSKKDFWDTVPEALEKVYSAIIITYKWRWFSLFALCVVQTRGNTFLAYPIIACIFVVIAASHRYVSRIEAEKARRQVYYVFSSTLVLTVVYGAIIGWFPEVRAYITAGSTAYRIEQDINAAYEAELQKDADRIGKTLKGMDAKLTFDQKVAKLSPEDRAAWERATRGWTREQVAAIRERAYPTLKMTLKEILPQGVQDWWNSPSPWFKKGAPASTAAEAVNAHVATAPATRPVPAPAAAPAAPATPIMVVNAAWEGYYAPSQHSGPMSIGSHSVGRYRVDGEGLREQTDPNNSGHYRTHDWRGQVVSEGGRCIVVVPKPEQMSVPFTGNGQCYGAVMVTVSSDQHRWVADGQCFDHPGGEILVNVNNGTHPYRYQGRGGHKLRLIRC